MGAAAKELGAELYTFDGGHLRDPYENSSLANVLYEIAAAAPLDGLIVWNHVHANYLTEDEAAAFLGRRSIPLVLIEGTYPGAPRIDLAGAQGFSDLMDHLIVHHRYTKIGYVGLMASHAGFIARHRAYLDSLARHGLAVDPRIDRPFWDDAALKDTGTILPHELRAFLSEAVGQGMQVLTCGSDNLAIQCLEAFGALGLRVPQDVALTGFDGFSESETLSPPLTTVRPDWEGLGDRAVRVLVDRIRGRPVAPLIEVPTTLLVGQSCGCRAANLAFFDAPEPSPVQLSDRLLAAAGTPPAAWPQFDALVTAFVALDAHPFLNLLEALLNQWSPSGASSLRWQNVLTLLERGEADRLPADSRVSRARVLVGNHAQHAEASRRTQDRNRALLEQRLGIQLVSSFGLKRLTDGLAESLPQLGVPGVWLALYEEPGPYRFPGTLPGWSRLVLALRPEGRVDLPDEGFRFKTEQFLPDEVRTQDGHRNFLVHSLHFDESLVGYIVFLADNPNGGLYESLRDQIAAAAYGALLLKKVNDRSRELSNSLDELHQTQARLVLSERMAALGELAATVAHELNSPLGALRSAATLIQHETTALPRGLLEFIRLLDTEDFALFQNLVAREPQQGVSSGGERPRRRALGARLAGAGVADADALADDIAFLVDADQDDALVEAATGGRAGLITRAARFRELLQAGTIVLDATDRAALTVSALVNRPGP
jgi:DNA-binding LacI/PurR family transcriptional regulator